MAKEKNKPTDIETKRHSLSHILAMAVLETQPGTKLGIGPSVENGFYYDFLLPKNISSDDLPEIEQKMRNLISQKLDFKKELFSLKKSKDYEKLREIFREQRFKIELIKEKQKEQHISVYHTGNKFTDLCAGPHINSTKEINPKAFKLTRIAGAYWRGDEKNKMLTRIYGVAFETKEELDNYLKQVKEAEERNHRKLGKELDLFCFSDLVGPGLPLYTPKGVAIIDELKKHIETVCRNYGFKKVSAPSLSKIELFEISGHAKKFGDELFHVSSEKKHNFVLKPVQCPHQTQIYASKTRSYRDLPIRYMESDKQYRAEKTGEVGGLSRVYAITVEDGHSFCRVDQVKQEMINMVNIIKEFYSALGMWGKHWVSLSVRDYEHPEKYIGEPKDWDKCEKMLQEISDEMGLDAKKCEGEAALYGPKLDFMFKDALGKEIQIPTVQLDFATPKRFNLTYINEKGKEENPVMVHRAVLGSYERFLVLLIEHFAGAFPLWLAPVQAEIIPLSEKFNEYGRDILKELLETGIRAEIDENDETLSKKIRNAELQKIPYLLVVGEKEEKDKSVAVRPRKGEKSVLKINEFLDKIKKEIEEKR
ncbi:MAG: threonine--tRNA ligase [Candidatus Pacebacteria bacterium]|nr:threonine--tRNA ligase [Candidatus Paceibacterota bacterium]